MSRTWTKSSWFWALVIAGCVGGDEVLLGRESMQAADILTLDSVDATIALSGLPEPKFLHEVPTREICAGWSPPQADLAVELSVLLDQSLCAGTECLGTSLVQLLPLADESAWVLLDTGSLQPLTRLAHYDPHGAELGLVDVPANNATIAIDDYGTLWLLATQSTGRTLQRFDSNARPLSEAVVVAEGAQGLATLPSNGVLMATAGTPASLTLFDRDGVPVWTKPTPIKGDNIALAVGKSRFALFGTTQREPSYAGIVVAVHSFTGALHWRNESTVNLETGGFSHSFSGSMDQLDGVTISVDPPRAARQVIERADYADLERFAADGTSSWAFRLQNRWPPFGSRVAGSGDIYLAAQTARGNVDVAAIDRISADGTACEQLIHYDVYALTYIAISPNGRLWLGQQQRPRQNADGARRIVRIGAGTP